MDVSQQLQQQQDVIQQVHNNKSAKHPTLGRMSLPPGRVTGCFFAKLLVNIAVQS